MKNSNRTLIQIILWVVMIAAVLIIGIYYFPRESPDLSLWGALYYTIRLFILEHDLGSFPQSPALIFIYFFAPVLALSALGTVLTYIYRFSPPMRIRWMSDHVIICGVGKTGQLLVEILQQKGVQVVGVDLGPPEKFEEYISKNKLPMVFGDFHSHLILKKAGFQRARTIIFASGVDLSNLEGVVGAYNSLCNQTASSSPRILWAHIANERLAKTAHSAIHTRGSISIKFFDTYYIAASKMVKKYFDQDTRKDVNEINILGFGKFGRDLMEVLVRDFNNSGRWTLNVVDKRNVQSEVLALSRDLNFNGNINVQQTNIQDLFLKDSEDKAFFLCTDDDIGNLAGALMLSSKMDCTHIHVRMGTWPMPAISDHLGAKEGLIFININDLIVQGVEDLPGIFEAVTIQP